MAQRKIVFYTHALSGGGAERVWALLASAFAAHGYDVIFAVNFEASENLGFLDPRVRLVTLKGGHLGSFGALVRLLRQEKPDVSLSAIGVCNLKHVMAATLTGRLRRSIITLHGYFNSEEQFLSRIGNLITPLASRLCGATICVSDGMRRHLVEKWHLSPTRTQRIYNPVMTNTNMKAASPAELAARQPIILAAGRLIHYKNYAMLIKAFAGVPMPSARLQILGEGPERPALEAQIEALGLKNRVELLGYHREPWSYFNAARCFALPSRLEPFGNVVVEALANGLPVIATKCHGPIEILHDDPSLGALVETDDVAGMTRALTVSLENPGDPAPRQRRADDFTVENAFVAYQHVVDSLLAAA